MKNISYISLIFVLFFGIASTSQAQTDMLEQEVNEDTTINKFRNNRTSHSAVFFDLGFAAGQTSGDSAPSILIGKSWSFKYGTQYNLRVNNFYSILGQLAYKRAAYYYEVKDQVLSQKLIMNNAMAEFSNRFSFGDRGSFIVNYFEIGVSADYAFMTKMKTVSETTSDIKTHAKEKTSYHGLGSLENLAYNAHARLGLKKLVLFGDYRLTDRLKSNSSYQLPPLTLGVRLVLGASDVKSSKGEALEAVDAVEAADVLEAVDADEAEEAAETPSRDKTK